VAVPQSDEVEDGVRLGLPQTDIRQIPGGFAASITPLIGLAN
jgi:hypothetical protein